MEAAMVGLRERWQIPRTFLWQNDRGRMMSAATARICVSLRQSVDDSSPRLSQHHAPAAARWLLERCRQPTAAGCPSHFLPSTLKALNNTAWGKGFATAMTAAPGHVGRNRKSERAMLLLNQRDSDFGTRGIHKTNSCQ